ncbi:MAG: hypothetical protein KDB27_06250, partial [Planctomycetales bacterium]|nr:hypothetical protein [Planctomycetales bacterium]
HLQLRIALGQCLVCVLFSSPLMAQPENPQPRRSDSVYMSWVKYEATLEKDDQQKCIGCHIDGFTEAEELAGVKDRLIAFTSKKEMLNWMEFDKHAIARRRVEPLFSIRPFVDDLRLQDFEIGEKQVEKEWRAPSNILSNQICRKLNYKYPSFRKNCLTCHGGYSEGTNQLGFERPGEKNKLTKKPTVIRIGIYCFTCHQDPEVSDERWRKQHTNSWRNQGQLLTPDEKTATGLHDLTSMSKQAALCMDCHVGNKQKGMFVTHEMYVAGHPPLPPFELETFCDAMPKHWKSPEEVHDTLESNRLVLNDYFAKNYGPLSTSEEKKEEPIVPSEQMWNTQKVLVGALVARQKTLGLYQSDAFPDFATFDCSACHHELRTGSLRQQRQAIGNPGRPRESEWQFVLLNEAYGMATLTGSVHDDNLFDHFASRPFGDLVHIRESSKDWVTSVDTNSLDRAKITRSKALSVFHQLLNKPEDELITYDSARQLIWALQSIAKDFKGRREIPHELVKKLKSPAVSTVLGDIPSTQDWEIFPAHVRKDLNQRPKFDVSQLG